MMKKLLVLLGTVMLLSSTVTQAFCMGASGVSADTYTPGGAYNPSGTSGTPQTETGEAEVIDHGHRCAFVGEEFTFTLGGAWSVESGITLPQGASFDYTTGVFTWTPQQGDINKTCHLVFRYCVAPADITAELNISVVDSVKVETGGFTEHISMDEYSGGKKVVWCEAIPPSTKAEVFMYDVVTKAKTQITNDYQHHAYTKIYGDNVVWGVYNNRGSLYELHVYNLFNRIDTPFAAAGQYFWVGGEYPAIYQDKIVYAGRVQIHGTPPEDPTDDDKEIYLYNISTGETKFITSDSATQQHPCIWGNYIIWEDYRDNGNAVNFYRYKISEGYEQILTPNTCQRFPAIWGDQLVWFDKRNYPFGRDDYSKPICPIAKWDIYAWDISKVSSTSHIKITDKPLSVAMSGGMWLSVYKDKIAALYSVERVEKDKEVTLLYNLDVYDIATKKMIRVLEKAANVLGPAICENKVAWIENESLLDGKFVRIAELPNFIMADITPPTGTIEINKGNPYTNSAVVEISNLFVSDGDGSGVSGVFLSNDRITWVNLSEVKDYKWTLSSGNGKKTLYAKIIDKAGNWSIIASNTVVLDITPPTGTIKINDGATYTTATYVALSLTASDTDSQVTEMQITNSPNAGWAGRWPFAATKNWTLPWGNGTKTVYARFKDAAGNWSAAVKDTIILDTSLPTTPVVTDGGTYTTSTTQLQVGRSNCSDPESYIVAGRYAIGTTSGGTDVKGWTQFMPPCPPNPFTIGGLSLVQGKIYYISLKFQNGAGLWSNPGCSDGITVTSDKTAPQITHTPITSAQKNKPIVFTAVVKDAGSGVNTVTLYWWKQVGTIRQSRFTDRREVQMTSQGNSIYTATLSGKETETWEILYHIQAQDKAGNIDTKQCIIQRK